MQKLSPIPTPTWPEGQTYRPSQRKTPTTLPGHQNADSHIPQEDRQPPWYLPAQARSRGCLMRSGLGGASFSRSPPPCRKPSHFLCLGGGAVGVGDGGAPSLGSQRGRCQKSTADSPWPCSLARGERVSRQGAGHPARLGTVRSPGLTSVPLIVVAGA